MSSFLCYTEVQQIKSVHNMNLKEEVIQMNECGTCEYVNINPSDFLKLGKDAGVLTAIEVIPVLWKNRDYEKIIAIAAILPTREEIETIIMGNLSEFSLEMKDVQRKLSDKLQKTLVAIKGSLSFCLNDSPYYLSEQSMEDLRAVALSDTEGILFWENKLLEVLSDEEKLGGQINIWGDHPNGIRNLIKIFHLPEDKMGELFRKALKENATSASSEFWGKYFSEIADLIEIFKTPEGEVRDVFEKVIENNKRKYPTLCIKIAQKMDIFIDSQEFCEMADGLFKIANKEKYSNSYRSSYVSEACSTYLLLKEKYSFDGSRDSVLSAYDSYVKNHDSVVNKVIFKASKVIEGKESFLYNKQGFWDIHL